MSVLFDNVKVGDTVHYSTPQGQTGKGKVVIHKGTHLVLNAGGKYGRPQVVTDKNYIKHSREGKVVGALLSRLSQVREATWQGAEDPYNWDPVMRKQVFDAAAKVVRAKQKQKGMPVPHELDKGRTLKSAPAPYRRGVKEETVNEVSKELAKRYVIAAVKDINYSSREAEGARTAAYADYMNKKAVKRSDAIAKSTKAMRAYKDHVWGKDIYKEDSKDAEGAAERVAKTKKHKKKLDEVSNTTLTNYVYKAIQDRKKNTIRSRNSWILHGEDDPERASSEAKAAKQKADKRHAGIKKAVAKIASNLPHEEPLKAHSDSEGAKHGGWSGMHEVAAPGKEAWIKANKQRFIDRYGKEKGLRVLYAKAWKDSKNESVNEEIKRYTTHHDDYMVTSTTGPAGHTISVRQGGTLIAQRLGGKIITNSKSGKKDTKLQDVIKAHTDHPEVQKFLKTNEARENEWAANQALAGQTRKKAAGHYLVRDGRTLSGPHKPEEAVKAYKGMSDSKGVKIVHVKETHMFDVTRELISEAKVKEAAQKAVNLKKKAKGNKHVETEPKLDLPDRVNTTTLSADEGQDNAKI